MEGYLILVGVVILFYIVYKPKSDKRTEERIKDLTDEQLEREYSRHQQQQGGYKTGGSHMRDVKISSAYDQELNKRRINRQ